MLSCVASHGFETSVVAFRYAAMATFQGADLLRACRILVGRKSNTCCSPFQPALLAHCLRPLAFPNACVCRQIVVPHQRLLKFVAAESPALRQRNVNGIFPAGPSAACHLR